MPFYEKVRKIQDSAAGGICKIQGEAFCGNTNNSSW